MVEDQKRIRAICDEYMKGREARIAELSSGNYGAYGEPSRDDKDLSLAWLYGSTDYDQEQNWLKTGRGRKAPWLGIREENNYEGI